MNDEPASVTASRQLAADSHERPRRIRGRRPENPVGQRGSGEAGSVTAARRAIRPLGRPAAEHLDVTGSAADPAAAEWRLDRAHPAPDAGEDERFRETS